MSENKERGAVRKDGIVWANGGKMGMGERTKETQSAKKMIISRSPFLSEGNVERKKMKSALP